MNNPDLVTWRKRHGSMCHVCPLNGQRHAGCNGNIDAPVIGIGDFPSEKDTLDGSTRGAANGRVFADHVGYFMQLEHLALAGLVRLQEVPGRKWPRIVPEGISLNTLIMCTIPGRKKAAVKINSPVGRAAQLCCGNSWRALMRRQLKENPERTLTPMGPAALSMLLGKKVGIESHRGRVIGPFTPEDIAKMLAPIPESVIYAKVLRGKKPTEKWWPAIEWFLNEIIKQQRVGVRKVAKHGLMPPEEWNTTRAEIWPDDPPNSWQTLCVANHAVILDIILKKQIAALKKRAKKENAACHSALPPAQVPVSSPVPESNTLSPA